LFLRISSDERRHDMKKHLGITIERRSKMNKLLGTGAAVLVLVLAAGCVQEPSAELTDSENIQSLLSGNSYVRMTPLEGQGESGDGGKDNGLPEHWWRELSSEGSFEVILENDPEMGICTVTVIRNLSANFNIDVTHDGVLNPGIKSISDIRTRRHIVENTGLSTDPHGGCFLQYRGWTSST
jgi:hypothetical protein